MCKKKSFNIPVGDMSKFKPNGSSSAEVTFCPGNNWLDKREPPCCWLRTPTKARNSFLVNSVTPLLTPRLSPSVLNIYLNFLTSLI